MHQVEQYIQQVKSGQRNAGKFERLAVDRFEDLRQRYHYDENEVQRVFDIVHACRFPKDKWKGKQIQLMPHQYFFLAGIFGLKKANGYRLIREAMLNMAKKGGKSALGGLVAVLYTFFDGKKDAECYVVANKTEQAMFAWVSAKSIAVQLAGDFPDFDADLKIYDNQQKHILVQNSSNNFLKTLPYESNTLDGVNPHFVLIDEFHEYPDTSVPDNMASGMVLRDEPLLLYTTTRGFHPYGPLAEKEEYYENVLTGKVQDDTIWPIIFALDNPKKWKDKKHWIQCAPGIEHDLPSEEALEAQMKKGLQEGGETLVEKMTKNFNIWQRAKSNYVDPAAWEKGAMPIDEHDLYRRRCFAAFDLGRNDDLSALGYFFPPEGNETTFRFLCRFFIPADMVEKRSREHKVSYRQWIQQGLVIETPGNYTDTAHLMDQIEKDCNQFSVDLFGADAAFAAELLNQLDARGYPVVKFPQNYSHMNEPTLKIPQMVSAGQLQHGGNKVLSWMMSNVTLRKNTGGQVMMDKSDRITGKGKDHKKGRKKIDGAVVLAMCVGLWLDSLKESESVYNQEGRGFLML